MSRFDHRRGKSGAADVAALERLDDGQALAIQPHGALLALDPLRGLRIVAASRNAAAILGLGASHLLGGSAAALLGLEFAAAAAARLAASGLEVEAPWRSTVTSPAIAGAFDATVHARAGAILVELEPISDRDGADALDAWRQLQDVLGELRASSSELGDVARVITGGIRRIAGYERVLIWKFDTDLNGQALFEDMADDWDQSLRGLRFVAADIAHSLRDGYGRSQIRWVPDRDAAPALVEVELEWATRNPPRGIDLSFAQLRPASDMRLRFFRNVGASGVLSLPISGDEGLWGLLVCHHRRPHYPSPSRRMAVATLADAFALRVGPAERVDTEQARRGDLARLSGLLAHMAQAEMVTPALTTGDVTIAHLFASTGAAVLYDGELSMLGDTPPKAELRELASWLRAQAGSATLFQTDNLAAVYPAWKAHAAIASGVLAVFLGADHAEMLLWFRPEEPELVTWASSLQRQPPGSPTVARASFERWVEMRRGYAKPWAHWELDIAETLRHAITEVVVRSLRRIADLNDQLRQSQKMEAVGQLTGGIAHDFNNLLTGILGSLEMGRAKLERGRTEDMPRYLASAIASANRAATLTHRLLAFSRRQTLDPKPVDVARLMASMEELIRRTTGPAIEVVTVAPPDLWNVLCDANQLENALLNLAINARDAMPDGGRLTIAAENSGSDGTSRQFVAIAVTDTGVGMSPETMTRVFEPFFTTKPLGQGTGLGLSMVYGFAEQSDGHARICSEPGQGTTVRLSLPRCLEFGRATDEAAEPPVPSATAAARTVLVVDDEPVVRMLVGDVLRDLGHQVIEAGDAAEGLRVLDSAQAVDLLVSDVGLPGGLNGRQMADAARVRRPKLKVLFITGYAEGALLRHGGTQTGAEIIVKPFGMNVLAAKICAMV